MIKVDWPLFLKKLVYALAILLAVFLTQKYISNEINIRTQIIQESYEKQLADVKLQAESEKINQKADYEKKIIELKNELQKAKILLEKIEQQKKYTKLIKEDTKKFMKEIDSIFNIVGKDNVKK